MTILGSTVSNWTDTIFIICPISSTGVDTVPGHSTAAHVSTTKVVIQHGPRCTEGKTDRQTDRQTDREEIHKHAILIPL